MKNPIFNKRHITEYIIFGLIAAILYMLPLLYFLSHNRYENFYYLYIGNILFMVVIFAHTLQLTYRPYDGKRAVSMMIGGGFTTVAGIIFCIILSIIAVVAFFPALFTAIPVQDLVRRAPGTIDPNHPSELLGLILVNVIIGNLATGTFIAVLTSYAGKRDQTKDKPASLNAEI